MRATFVRLAALTLALVSLVACTEKRELLAPRVRNDNFIAIERPFFPVLDKGESFVEIAAGERHTCARKSKGTVYCWGSNLDRQLGFDPGETCGTFGTDGPCAKQPMVVPMSSTEGALSSAIRLDVGNHHTCVLDPNRIAWCWGENLSGQVGYGPGWGGYLNRPTRVYGGLTFLSIGAGGNQTCGTRATPAGTANETYCWGNGVYAPALIALGGAFTQLAVAGDHACGDLGNRNWLCWGSNNSGQLAVDPMTMTSAPPYVWVHAVDGAARVEVAGGYTCADQSTGSVQCFGRNMVLDPIALRSVPMGLGNPQFTGSATHLPQSVAAPGSLHGVAVGDNHGCALDVGGAAWCWGRGDIGQLGNNVATSSATPVLVAGGHTFRALAVGVYHTCGIGTDNTIWCWGDNYYGQLGNRSASIYQELKPVQAIVP